jgi:hypothetical protein
LLQKTQLGSPVRNEGRAVLLQSQACEPLGHVSIHGAGCWRLAPAEGEGKGKGKRRCVARHTVRKGKLAIAQSTVLHNAFMTLTCDAPQQQRVTLRSDYEWRGCPQVVSRESHRTRNKNKQTNKQTSYLIHCNSFAVDGAYQGMLQEGVTRSLVVSC